MQTAAILLYERVNPLDFTGPRQVLPSVAGLEIVRASPDARGIGFHGRHFTRLADLESLAGRDFLCVPAA